MSCKHVMLYKTIMFHVFVCGSASISIKNIYGASQHNRVNH